MHTYEFSNISSVEANFRAALSSSQAEVVAKISIPAETLPIRVTSGFGSKGRSLLTSLRAGVTEREQTAEAACNERRQRKPARQKRVIAALRAQVENDPQYRSACEEARRVQQRYANALKSQSDNPSAAHRSLEEVERAADFAQDFYLVNLAAIATRIERCGSEGAFACGSDYCPHCRRRFGARLLEDTQVQLSRRYGEDLEKARNELVHVTILNDIVIPDPDLDRDYLANFSASTIRRDHRELLAYLKRWQSDRLSAMSHLLAKRKLSMELFEDWMTAENRDRRFYNADNLYADAIHLVRFNELIESARRKFKRKRNWLESPPNSFVSWRAAEDVDPYMWQLRQAQILSRDDIFKLAHGLQCIYRQFDGLTKTNFPERLKFKSSIEKVIRRERSKLYRLNKDLPGVSLIGQFELELVDLRHSIGGTHQHRTKSQTLRALASQPRKQPKQRTSNEPPSPEAERRRIKQSAKARLLDDARERIAGNLELPESDFPGLQFAVLLHIHALVDLNGHYRDDLERWLSGKQVGKRKFKGFWRLPYQVMVKKLFEAKPVHDSLRDISFYPFKGPTTFNYENTAPKHDEDLPDEDPANFPDEALALLAWLQVGIGHESLRLSINWPSVDRERRGRKPNKTVIPKVTEEEFYEEIEPMLAERGLSFPIEPSGQTDLSELFEAEDIREGMSRGSRNDECEEEGDINDTAPSPTKD
ncbi:hypothetical protein [Methylorubrum extorquens]|uniref:hypothetical protein n=1 Tax=Methylorubrum extorquens TaxID=408 RepID=UPI0012377E7A|nr:hypothetical protein [Methylorubrum extorquens]WIU40258.1 hypothetical protein KQ926_02500 [Methylorubrum extorquens]